MEITLDAIISFVGMFLGSGTGIFAWKYVRRRSKAEAQQAEAQALKEKQDYYQRIIDDVVKDRDYYKSERDEQRERTEKLSRAFMDWRIEADNDRSNMKMEIARLGRRVSAMTPFICGDLQCKLRKRVTVSDDGMAENAADDLGQTRTEAEQADIEPIEQEAL